MGNVLYVVAIILVIGWVIGVFGYKAGGIVHLLLFVALFIVVLRLIRGKKLL